MALGDLNATSADRASSAAHRADDAARLVGDERLPCGRLLSQVWERARDARVRVDAHTAGCTYCRQAVEGLRELDTAIRTLRTERSSARTVAHRVMREVRAEARLGRFIPLNDATRKLRISETAAAKVLRRAADGVPGVRSASCRLTSAPTGADVAVSMTLAVSLDSPMPARATRVRRAVAYAARQQLGIAPSRIDLTIVSELASPGTGISRAAPPHAGGRK